MIRPPWEDFHGLSPQDMDDLLYQPFEAPRIVRFAECLETAPDAPILHLFMAIAEAIRGDGLRATAKSGNLPIKFCRALHGSDWGWSSYRRFAYFGGLTSEVDFPELHVTRQVAQMAGLLRRRKGQFILSREARRILDSQGPGGIYPRLFRGYVLDYNWAYTDGYSPCTIIQQSAAFTLYLLSLYGQQTRPVDFYIEAFRRAFPMAVQFFEGDEYVTPEDWMARAYCLRALERFAGFLGLARLTWHPGMQPRPEADIESRPLLAQMVQFRIGGATLH